MATLISDGFSTYTSDNDTPGGACTNGTVTVAVTGPGVYVVHVYAAGNFAIERIVDRAKDEVLVVHRRMARVLDGLRESMHDLAKAFEKAMIRAEEARERRPKNWYPDSDVLKYTPHALLLSAPLTFRRRTTRASHNRGPLLNFCKM